jgi:predicted metal-binding protein
MAKPPKPAARPPDTLYVCRTCPRDQWRVGVAAGEGERFAQAVRAALATSPLASEVDLLVLHCLGGCPKPCNAALTGAGKVLLRFNRLREGDVAALLDLAALFRDSSDGEIVDQLPPGLKDRLALRLRAEIARS